MAEPTTSRSPKALSAISRLTPVQKIALGALRKANPGVDLGRLSIGQELVLP